MGSLTLTLLLFFCSLAEARFYQEWNLHLDTRVQETYFPQEYGQDTNQNLTQLELNPIFDLKFSNDWKFFLKPTFVSSPNNKSTDEQTFFDPTETYLRYKGDVLKVQAGYNVFSWGVTDGYNPLDVLNPKQYFNPLDSKKKGVLSLAVNSSWDPWDIEAIYIPWSSGAQLPGRESRWLPREIFIPQTQDNNLVLLLPETLRYNYGSHQDLNDARSNNYALKISRRGEHFDFSFSGYEGVATFPLVEPLVTGSIIQVSPKTVVQVDPDVTLNTKNYRIRQGGFTLVNHSWDFLIKLASSYTQSQGDLQNLPGWTHENVAALERTFTLGESAVLIAVLQHSFIFSDRKNDSNLSATEIFRRAWMLGGKMSWKEVWSFSLLGLYDQERYSHYEEISIARKFFDAWNIALTARFIQGDQETPLGVYGKNDSYSLSVLRSF